MTFSSKLYIIMASIFSIITRRLIGKQSTNLRQAVNVMTQSIENIISSRSWNWSSGRTGPPKRSENGPDRLEFGVCFAVYWR